MGTRVGAFAVASAYVGTIVGAGFASGQEVLRFFTEYGPIGTAGLPVITLLFAWLGTRVLQLGRRTGAVSYQQFLHATAGRAAGRLIDLVVTAFLFLTLSVMVAGSGSVFREQWGLPSWLGSIVMAAAALTTVMFGIQGVIRSISAVAPVLVLSVLYISAESLVRHGLDGVSLTWSRPEQAAAPIWWISPLLYVSYNLVLAVPVLAPLGAHVNNAKTLTLGGYLGGLGLGLAATAVHLGILSAVPHSAAVEVPMLHLAQASHPAVQHLFSLVLWAEVYTTAVANLFGLARRLTSSAAAYRWAAIILATLSLAVSRFGFSRLVAVVYPAVGWAGLVLITTLAYEGWRHRN